MAENIVQLLLSLIERVGVVLAVGLFLLTLTPMSRLGVVRRLESKYWFLQAVVFGGLGILGTYTGNVVFESYANLRGMFVITGGLFGGPLVGTGAGLIAGVHRFAIDPFGFSSVPCALATVLEGIAAGYVSTRLKGNNLNWKAALYLSLGGESLHQLMVLTMAKPFEQALDLVKVISLPMIVVNTFGAVMFVQVMHMMFQYRSRRESSRVQQILNIANKTVVHLRSGLNRQSALATAQIIWDRTPVAAVVITDTHSVLAYVGRGDDHHFPGQPLKTKATKRVISTGMPVMVTNKNGIGCESPGCPLTTAVIVPMRKADAIVGCLKLYGDAEIVLDEVHFELAKGLAELFSTQLELEDIQIKNQLLAKAEIRRLQAQINPHFLFNALNTIASFCRTKPDKARTLLDGLATYMRRNLRADAPLTPLSREIEQVRSYLEIEQARFGDRIQAHLELEPGVEECMVPPLVIQPLVENSVKHGILGMDQGGLVTLRVSRNNGSLNVEVEDNGVGMDLSRVDKLLNGDQEHDDEDHVGIRNCDRRLEQIYGPKHRLNIASKPGKGAKVSFSIPLTSLS